MTDVTYKDATLAVLFLWALITYIGHSEVCTYLRYKTIEKFYSNPTTYNYGIVYRMIGLDSRAIVITVFIPLRFSIFVLNSQPKLQMLST